VFEASNGRQADPKRFRKPKPSMSIPQNGYFRNTRRIPPRKHAVPRSLFFRAKK
jgi:hypothetical protein